MNGCMNIYELIQKELDGELTTEESALLEKHCVHCFSCRQLREDFLQDVLALSSLPLPIPDKDFTINVMAAITKSTQQKPKHIFSNFTGLVAGLLLLLWASITIIGAAVIALIVGGVFYWADVLSGLGTLLYRIAKIVDILGVIFPPSLLMFLLLTSMGSFLLLMMLIYSRGTLRYEN
ncbi:MAG: anti-sigma factor family protein [Bacillota bacterium]